MDPQDDQALVRWELAEGVALLTLNRPDKLNAFNAAMLDQWVAALERSQADPAVRAIVVTGAGRAFCSGGDVDEMGRSEANTPLRIKQRLQQGVQRIPHLLSRMDKPVIVALNGVATGAGLDLALMADIRFMAASARVGETYAKVGLVPGAGGAWFLPRLVGVAKALELFWSAELLDAQEALRIGLVNRVCADEELLPQALAFARQVAQMPPLSIELIKRAVYQSTHADLATSLDLVSSHMTVVRNSRDHAEAIAALRERRKGHYEGC